MPGPTAIRIISTPSRGFVSDRLVCSGGFDAFSHDFYSSVGSPARQRGSARNLHAGGADRGSGPRRAADSRARCARGRSAPCLRSGESDRGGRGAGEELRRRAGAHELRRLERPRAPDQGRGARRRLRLREPGMDRLPARGGRDRGQAARPGPQRARLRGAEGKPAGGERRTTRRRRSPRAARADCEG